MSLESKQIKAQLKSPDSFVSFMDFVVKKMRENQGALLTIVILLVVAGVGISLVRHFHEKKLVKLNQEIYEITKNNSTESLKALIDKHSDEEVVQLLRLNTISKLVEEKKYEDALNQLKTDQEKLPAEFQPLADIMMVHLLWEVGKTDEALAALDQMKPKADSDIEKYIQFLKAEIYESKGQKEEAIQLYSKLSTSFDKDPTLMNKARTRLLWLKLNP